MTLDLISMELLQQDLNEKALAYLQNAIPEKHRLGVATFASTQSKPFNQHASDLAAVLMAIEQEGTSLNLKHKEQFASNAAL
jgi:hypothetical protein